MGNVAYLVRKYAEVFINYGWFLENAAEAYQKVFNGFLARVKEKKK